MILGSLRAKCLSALLAGSFVLQSTQLSWAASNSDASAEVASGLEVAPSVAPVFPSGSATSRVFPEFDTSNLVASSTLSSADQIAVATQGADDQAVLRGGVASTPEAAVSRAEELTKQIMLKLIELEKFNMHYTLEVAKQGRWKGWRYGMLNEVNSCMGLAGGIISVTERGSHIHNPLHVNNARQENANFIPMIGAIIGASAAVIEFGINEYHCIQAGQKGFSAKAARLHVQGIKDDVDRMLAERALLVKIEASAPMLLGHAEVDDAEGRVLKDLRDQGLQEFERFHISARRVLAFQQMQYFFDFSKNVTSAIGYDFSFLSLHRHHRIWNGRAGVLFVTSGALYMFGPVISRVFAKGMAEGYHRALRPTIQQAEQNKIDQLVADHATLDRLCKDTRVAPDSVTKQVDRSAMYGRHEKQFQDEINSSQKSRNKAKLTATQNYFGGFFVGGCKVASGVFFIIPGFNPHYRAKTGFRAARVTNDDLFTASVISLPASAYAILDTLRINVMGEITLHRLKKNGKMPAQLAAARLHDLDTMEARIKGTPVNAP